MPENPEIPEVFTAEPVRAVKPKKAAAAAAGGTAGTAAALVVNRITELSPEEAVLVAGLLASVFATVGAYVRQVGPVVLRRIGLPPLE